MNAQAQETCLRLTDLPANSILKLCEIGPLRGAARPIDEAALASIVRNADEPIPVYMIEATMLNVIADARQAAGWITSIETRDNGTSLFGRCEWSDTGRRKAPGRYIVPCIDWKSVPGLGPMGARLSMVVLVLKPAGKFQFQPIDAGEVSMRMSDAVANNQHRVNRILDAADLEVSVETQRELTDKLMKQGMTYEDAMCAAHNRVRLGLVDE